MSRSSQPPGGVSFLSAEPTATSSCTQSAAARPRRGRRARARGARALDRVGRRVAAQLRLAQLRDLLVERPPERVSPSSDLPVVSPSAVVVAGRGAPSSRPVPALISGSRLRAARGESALRPEMGGRRRSPRQSLKAEERLRAFVFDHGCSNRRTAEAPGAVAIEAHGRSSDRGPRSPGSRSRSKLTPAQPPKSPPRGAPRGLAARGRDAAHALRRLCGAAAR